MFETYTLKAFVENTAAPDAVPGGGSVSALAGALAAALAGMVAGLTLKKEKFAAVAPQMSALHQRAVSLQSQLLAAVDKDSESYQAVLTAFRLPKGTPNEIQVRTNAIQIAFIGACQIPLQVAEMALQVTDLAVQAAGEGNPDMITDAGVSAMMARSAALGALMNVRINLAGIKDPHIVGQMEKKIRAIKGQVIKKEQEMFELFEI